MLTCGHLVREDRNSRAHLGCATVIIFTNAVTIKAVVTAKVETLGGDNANGQGRPTKAIVNGSLGSS